MDKTDKMMNLIKCCNAGGMTTMRKHIEEAWNGTDGHAYINKLAADGKIKIAGSDSRIVVLS